MQDVSQMELLQDIFSQVVFEKHGYRFDLQLLPQKESLRTILERHKRDAERWLLDVRQQHVPQMGHVHFDYIEDQGMNALAFESNGHEFVGVYVGTLVTFYSFFGCMLANGAFLPSIGDVSIEVNMDPDPSNKRWIFRQPQDPARRSYAHLLATIAIEFIFTHELAHLMNGHVRLLNKSCGLGILAEFDQNQPNPLDNIALQTLEMDADSFAVTQGLGNVFGRTREPGKVFPENWRQWYGSQEQAIQTWMLAIYALFRLFYRGPIDLDNLDSGNHPPPGVRMLIAIGTAHEFLQQGGHFELERKMESIFGEVLETVESAHSAITCRPPDLTAVAQSTDSRALMHVKRLLDQWKVLRPQLEPLHRVRRLPK